MTRWYRRYAGTVSDPKIAEAAMIAACSRSVVIAAWDMILESAAETDGNGAFRATFRNVAATLNETLETIERVFEAFAALGMIDSMTISAWSKRQYQSDVSTSRVRRHREKAGKINENQKCNGTETFQKRYETVPDTDTDTELSEGKYQPATTVETVAASELAEKSDAENALDDMVASVRRWGAGMNEFEARTWLTTTARTFGHGPTMAAYHRLKTELLTGSVVGHPLRAWSAIAERLRGQEASRKASGGDARGGGGVKRTVAQVMAERRRASETAGAPA